MKWQYHDITVHYICWEGKCNHSIFELVKKKIKHLPPFVPMFTIQAFAYMSYTSLSVKVVDCSGASSSLDLLNLGYLLFSLCFPCSQSILQLQLRSDHGLVCNLIHLWNLGFLLIKLNVRFTLPTIMSTRELQENPQVQHLSIRRT